MAFQDTSVSMLGSGQVSVIEYSQVTHSVSMLGSGGMSVSPVVDVNPGAIDFAGSLSSGIGTGQLLNNYISAYGFLNVSVSARAVCYDIVNNFIPQHIISNFCKNKGESVALKRFKNDTYPVTATLSKDGVYDITGFTIKLSTQIGTGTVYTSTGNITDAVNGNVEFILDAGAIDTAGEGTYDIEVNDGTYVYTYEKGVFEIVEDLTPPPAV